MTLTSTTSSTDLWALLAAVNQGSQTNSTSSTSATSSSGTDSASSTSSSSDSSSLSTTGQLFSALDELSKSDPSEFKKITAEISKELTTAANNSTDPTQTDLLKQLAANFSKASRSGNFSDLFSNSGDSISSIFSQALQQIQSDLGTATSSQS